MIPEKFLEVLKYEGVASIATQGENGPHLSSTWNSYLQVTENESLIYPAGGMQVTEKNIKKNNRVLMTVGSREVEGFHGHGTGFRIEGTATFLTEGSSYEQIKQKFPWPELPSILPLFQLYRLCRKWGCPAFFSWGIRLSNRSDK